MKAVILAGGLGTRISEESGMRPKPMIEVGGKPIIWHIMKMYSKHGINDFVICLGYKGYIIKEYFANLVLHTSNVLIDAQAGKVDFVDSTTEPWRIALVDTGELTMTGGRVKRIGRFLTPDEPFCMTYGDGVSDVDISRLTAFHKQHGKLATVTAVIPPGRYGALDIQGDLVSRFIEKPPGDNGLINGGFFVLHPKVLERIADDNTSWEHAPLASLASDGQLVAFRHSGFWQPMDTLRDKQHLEELWKAGKAPWKCW